jgi:hypothetical protein
MEQRLSTPTACLKLPHMSHTSRHHLPITWVTSNKVVAIFTSRIASHRAMRVVLSRSGRRHGAKSLGLLCLVSLSARGKRQQGAACAHSIQSWSQRASPESLPQLHLRFSLLTCTTSHAVKSWLHETHWTSDPHVLRTHTSTSG